MTPLERAFIQEKADSLDEINATLAVLSDEIANREQRSDLRRIIATNMKVSRHLKTLLYETTEDVLNA